MDGMKVLVDIAVEPLGTSSTSISKYVKKVLEILDKKGIKYYSAPSMTTMELDDITQLGFIIKDINDELEKMGVKRIITLLKIDDRRDKENSIGHKLEVIRK